MVRRTFSSLRGVSPLRALCLLTVLLITSQVFAVNQFLTPTTYPTGLPKNFYPQQAIGDFNGDGKIDVLLIAPYAPLNQTKISVLPGKANGTFGAPILTNLSAAIDLSLALAVGDFNGDGKLDVAVSDRSSQKLALLLGNGDGTFSYQLTSVALSTGGGPVAAVDLNGDGKTDLIFLSISSSLVASVQGLLSNGDGTFQAQTPVSFALPPSTQGALTPPILGDFNLDGKIDFALGDYYGNFAFLLLSNGDGTFQYKGATAIGAANSSSLAAGDFNRDGKLDLVGNGKILLGNGDGTFQSAISTAATLLPSVAGDFNGDGKLDVFGFGCVSLGNGNGTFQSPSCFPGERQASVTDLNGDGKIDLLWWDSALMQESVALGFGDGTFPVPYFLQNVAPATGIATADFNRDGKPDLAIATCADNRCVAKALGLSLGKGDGTFQAPLPPVSGYQGGTLFTGDFNSDGKPDLIEVNSANFQIFLGNGDGTFLSPVTTPFGSSPYCRPLIADVNHDGRLDFVAGSGPSLFSLLGNGDGTFGTPNLIFKGRYDLNFCGVVGGDFNGDGKIDLAAFDGRNHILIFSGNGDGTFNTFTTFQSDFGVSMIAADFTGDGKLDITTGAAGVVTVYNGKGDGTFVKGKTISPGAGGVNLLSSADFNGDGRPDIAGNGNALFLGLGTATGSFNRELFASGGYPASLAVADFNRDGAPDIALQNQANSAQVVIYLNTGAVAATLTSSSNPSTVGQPVAFKTTVAPTLRGVIGTPTGTVTFKDGSTVLATIKVASGSATFTTSTLVKGTHSLTATYSGDGNFIPKSSSVLTQVVQ